MTSNSHFIDQSSPLGIEKFKKKMFSFFSCDDEVAYLTPWLHCGLADTEAKA